ncbi:MAG: hypothetical protein KBD64_01605 [Gammaproteobacteria bacterium]|nr:hypothetical protein [Gammaproteobacteria bacterium]
MSVKSKKKTTAKKSVAKPGKSTKKRTTAKKAVAKNKSSAAKSKSKSAAAKTAKRSAARTGVASKNSKSGKKTSSTSSSSSALPGTKLAQAYKTAYADTKKMMVPASKKANSAKQALTTAAKKLKSEQDNLAKLEQRHSAKPSAVLNKQVGSAKNKVKAAMSVHSKAEAAHNSAHSSLNNFQRHLDKLTHLEKTHKDAWASWDKQNSQTINVPAKSSKPVSSKPTAQKTSKPAATGAKNNSNNNKSQNKNKSGSTVFSNLDDDSSWTKFDDKNLFSKVDSMAEYDSEKDDRDLPWQKNKTENK